MKKILGFIGLVFCSLFLLTSCDNTSYDVVVTSFPCYDAVKASTKGTDINVKMLLKPGSDIHSYQPSATDIKSIINSKLFVYVGGESDEWVESDILTSIDKDKTKVVSMFEVLEGKLIQEDDEDEYDEHVWTDPSNYEMVIKAINDELCDIYSDLSTDLVSNKDSYINELTKASNDMKDVIDNSNNKTIVVADRNPYRYFGEYYKLTIIGALSGCSSDKNVPLAKVIELKDAVETNQLKYVFVTEYSSNTGIAEAIMEEIEKDINSNKYNGSNVGYFALYSMQRISADDFNNGVTYVDMLKSNVNVIRTALS